ncbi:LuxR C-terminal-related transcriptional regulator [Kitasatospora sp. NPDC049285]|uniref:LuxR C-terminal-related transcriptional regulator n=1 Tax=Kitasatospora sp. NPDC049285 TaxID=3157096 RepID=UPI003415052D
MTDPLPSEAERQLYRDILDQGGRVMFREAMEQDPDGVLRLIELGLLVHQGLDQSLSAVDPRSAGERIKVELRSRATGLLVQAERTAGQLEELTHAYEATANRADRTSAVQHVTAVEQIRHRILQIESEMREETLAAQPGGARLPAFMAQALERDRRFLAAGISLRTLYQPGALDDPPTVEYAAARTACGERIRVLDEPYQRLLIFDRKIAIMPASADEKSAAIVEDPAVVGLLVERFERDWRRARPVNWHALAGRTVGVPAELARLLTAGHTQRAIATRLGLSERTVAAHISRLRELYDAETQFQLGWLMRDGAR